ncbi:MAG: TRAP transporter substrate-binding protein [Oscillospiraceae bacterium]
MKKVIALFLTLAMIFALAACGSQSPSSTSDSGSANDSAEAPAEEAASDDVIVLQAGHVLTEDSGYHQGLLRWAELVNERTDGHIKIEVYPNSTLGNERDMIEAVQMGMLDITIPNHAPMANFTDAFNVFDLPFLFANRDEAYAVCDSDFAQGILDSLADINIVGISLWENGMRYLANNKLDVVDSSDLAGLKIRTMENTIHIASFTAWGADPTPMAFGEVYTSLQQGTIDGCEIPLETIYQNKIYEVANHITMTGHFYCTAPLLMSFNAWDRLTEEEQQILVDAANEVKPYERQLIKEADEAYYDLMKEEGVIFVDQIDADEWRSAAQSVYDSFEQQDVLKQVQDIIAASK